MRSYFENSQKVRKIAESSQGILTAMQESFTDNREPLSQGTHNVMYRIGHAQGTHFALRRPLKQTTQSAYERFCQFAAVSAIYHQDEKPNPCISELVRPVAFCIGVTFGEEFGILTEDVSENGRYSIEPGLGLSSAKLFYQDEYVDNVFLDLDVDNHVLVRSLATKLWETDAEPNEQRPHYFDSAHTIRLYEKVHRVAEPPKRKVA